MGGLQLSRKDRKCMVSGHTKSELARPGQGCFQKQGRAFLGIRDFVAHRARGSLEVGLDRN
jgi:hypothetical protein